MNTSLHVSAGNASLALFGPTTFGGKLYVGAAGGNITTAQTAQVIATDGNLHLDPASGYNLYLSYYNNSKIFIGPNDPGGGSGDAAWMRYYAETGENTRLEIRVQNDADDDIYIRATGGVTTGTGDLAELYFSEENITLGDLVVFDPTRPASVKKSTSPYEDKILGVTSSKPLALLMSSGSAARLDDPRYKPISLSGKIIVKVSLENGPIKVGDPLTSASVPGHVMKATKTAYIVGYAFEDFDGSEQSAPGVEDMYDAFSKDAPNLKDFLRILAKTSKKKPGSYQTGVMIVSIRPGLWIPPEMARLQETVNTLQQQLLELTRRLEALEGK